MNYRKCLTLEIDELMMKANMITLEEVKDLLKSKNPIYIRDYIDKFWSEHSEGFRDDLEHEVRKFWLNSGDNFHELSYRIEKPKNKTPMHWSELSIHNQDLDIWIMESGTSFNPADIAQIIYLIYMKEITFRK